jgi:hypothetical protein
MHKFNTAVSNQNIASHSKSIIRMLLGFSASVTTLLMVGCAQVSSVQPGTPVSDVIRKFGRPVVTCAQADGTRRMVWTEQPQGETAFALAVSADKRVGAPEQLLSDQHFAMLSNGDVWTPEKIRCQFGPPANITAVGFGQSKQQVWGYRYMQPGAFPAMLYIYMGRDGNAMTRYESAPDPDRNEEVMGGSH